MFNLNFTICRFVKAEDTSKQIYVVQMLDIIRHLGLNKSEKNYQRVAEAFQALNTKTALYLRTYKNGKNGIIMTSLFDYIEIIEDGKIEFQFSQKVAPYVFELKQNFYSFKLSELSNVRSKYTLIKSKLARNSATLKLIPYFLANVKVKLRLLLWSVRVA